VEDKGEVRWVSLNRPDTHNAFNELVIGEITDAFRTIQRDAAQHRVHHIIFSLFLFYPNQFLIIYDPCAAILHSFVRWC
jgi:hypothetical protein